MVNPSRMRRRTTGSNTGNGTENNTVDGLAQMSSVGGLIPLISRIREWWEKRKAWKQWRQENMDEWARNNGIVSIMAYHKFQEEYADKGDS